MTDEADRWLAEAEAKDPERAAELRRWYPTKTDKELRAAQAREVNAFGPGDDSAGDDKHKPLSLGALAEVAASEQKDRAWREPDSDEIAAGWRGELDDEDDEDVDVVRQEPPVPTGSSLSPAERARALAAERSRRYRANRRKK